MELYILRHAIAMEREDWHESDDARPLTSEGIVKMKQNAIGMVKLVAKPNLIITSPLVRARQTAQIAAKAYGIKGVIEESDALTPESSSAETIALLKKYAHHTRVMIVGHEPHLGAFLAHLIHSAQPLPLKKGGLALINIDFSNHQLPTHLEWLLTPRLLRLMARTD